MCSPDAVRTGVSLVVNGLKITTQVASTVNEVKTQEMNNKYRAQVAINNVKEAQNNAKELQQAGIEKSRLQKIEGLRQIERQKAQNGANGFNLNSFTNTQSYDDTLSGYNSNAQNILDDYNSKADSYYSKANNYLNSYTNNYNQNQYKSAVNALGNTLSVAKTWYSNTKEDNNVNI